MPSLSRVKGRAGFARPALLLAGLHRLDVERAHRAVDDEIAIVEPQRARNAVLVYLEGDRIDRRLLARLVGASFFALVEIADGDRPAREAAQHILAGRRIVELFVRLDALS